MAPPSSPSEQPSEPPSSTSTNSPTPISTPSPIPPPIPVETHPNRIKPTLHQRSPDPSRLAPEDALTPPRLRPVAITSLDGHASSSAAARAAAAALRPAVASLRAPPAIPPVAARLEQERRAARAARKRAKHAPHVWKKLLWVKQIGYPDNYTDPATFLGGLERPKLRPYEFWPLVADSMVIVQHVCAMLVFVCAYAGIYQDRLSPVAVVVCGSFATVVGWVLWDQWKCEEESDAVRQMNDTVGHVKPTAETSPVLPLDDKASSSSAGSGRPVAIVMNGHANGSANGTVKKGLGLRLSTANLDAKNAAHGIQGHHGLSLSKSSLQSISPVDPLAEQPQLPPSEDYGDANGHALIHFTSHQSHRSTASHMYIPQSPTTLPSTVSPRNQARIKTFKSALLIYFALLGLSPILKSLTKSTSSDSIWALATWLLIINIFFFDYGSHDPFFETSIVKNHFRNSDDATAHTHNVDHDTVHGGDTPTPKHLPFKSLDQRCTDGFDCSRFSTSNYNIRLLLTLFSIQIFGLFPLFRRHLRSRSMNLHTLLTVALVLMASAGLGLILSQSYTHTYGNCGYCLSWCVHVFVKSLVGVIIGGTTTVVTMGGCAWWLITLQRYKNVVIGPWDPAKPMLAGGGRVGDGG